MRIHLPFANTLTPQSLNPFEISPYTYNLLPSVRTVSSRRKSAVAACIAELTSSAVERRRPLRAGEDCPAEEGVVGGTSETIEFGFRLTLLIGNPPLETITSAFLKLDFKRRDPVTAQRADIRDCHSANDTWTPPCCLCAGNSVNAPSTYWVSVGQSHWTWSSWMKPAQTWQIGSSNFVIIFPSSDCWAVRAHVLGHATTKLDDWTAEVCPYTEPLTIHIDAKAKLKAFHLSTSFNQPQELFFVCLSMSPPISLRSHRVQLPEERCGRLQRRVDVFRCGAATAAAQGRVQSRPRLSQDNGCWHGNRWKPLVKC